jgi:hypothetical protein
MYNMWMRRDGCVDHQTAETPHEEDEVRSRWVEFDDPELDRAAELGGVGGEFGYEPGQAVVCAIAPLLHLQ